MMRHLKLMGLGIPLMLVLLMVIPFCTADAAEGGPIKIGMVVSYTGSFAGKGDQIEAGARLRLDELGWEVAGRKIVLVKEDAESSAEKSVDKVRKAIGVDKVNMVIGPLKGECLTAIAPLCAKAGVPLLSVGVVRPQDVAANETLFGTYGPEMGMAVGLGRYANQVLGYKTTVYMAHDYLFSHTLSKSFSIGFKEKGGVIVKERYIPFGTTDYTTYLTAAGRPDCLTAFLAGTPDVLRFYRQNRELGLNLPVVAPEGGSIGLVLDELGDDVIGTIGSVPYTTQIDTDISRRFVQNFEKKYGYTPTQNEERGYTVVSYFAKALEATGGDTTSAKILSALKKTKIDVPSGHLEFADRIGRKDIFIFKGVRKGGKIVLEVVDTFVNVLP